MISKEVFSAFGQFVKGPWICISGHEEQVLYECLFYVNIMMLNSVL